ncbi:MAG: hypothetical protein Lokiarch_12860 [Candidatus Lokiarchaeum sp. GC14_75]|nr:MAG: hypothetical protein Lokiarch_12860 [Candidatus Lokiarchaeum sp. GC14_75]
MIEKNLEDFEEFYQEKINSIFYKIKRASKKLMLDIRENLIEVKVCLDHFIEAGTDKIDSKALKSLNFFSVRIRREIDEIKFPEDEINYDNIMDLLNSIKKLFTSINEIARKSLPKFQKEVQPQIKELNYLTRKLGKKQAGLDGFLRKKYTDVKEAEYLLKKLPKIFTLKENIENAKTGLEQFEEEIEERNRKQDDLNSQLIELEKNKLFSELENVKNKLFQLQIKINNEIGFKKALKKLKFKLEKNSILVPNVDLNYLKDFLKNPIKILVSERKDLPKFTSLMVQLRHALEENKLNLKTETKQKTIEHINAIFDEKLLQENIKNYMGLKDKIKTVEEKIEEAGLAKKLENLKNQISTNAVKLEHVQNDYNRKNKDYTKYLGTLKNDREEFQTLVENVVKKKVKINIVFTF